MNEFLLSEAFNISCMSLEKQHVLPLPGSLDLVQEAPEEILWPVFNQMNWKKRYEKINVQFSGDKWKVPYFGGNRIEQSRK